MKGNGKKRLLIGAGLAVICLAAASLFYLFTHLGVHLGLEMEQPQPDRLQVSVVNTGLSSAQVRQVAVLSAFDGLGQPLDLDGTATSPASVDLLAPESGLPAEDRSIQGHQSVYVSALSLGASNPLRSITGDAGDAGCTEVYELRLDETGAYAGAILRLDVFLLTREQEDSGWTELCAQTLVLGSGEGLGAVSALPAQIPALTDTLGFQWDVKDGAALLRGMGTVTEEDLVLPTRVSLVETDGGWMENVLEGEPYDVVISGKAFEGCKFLHTVTFQEGAVLSEGYRASSGAEISFANCTALEAVYGLPGDITDLNGAFRNCTALETAPELPASVVKLQDCFTGCTSLTQAPELPEGVANLNSCFSGCTALAEPPVIPDGVTTMQGCFFDCASLTEAPVLPEGLTSLKNCFSGCASLKEAPEIPAGVTDLVSCFSGCTSLTRAPELPEGLVDLTGAFDGCTALVSVSNIPSTVIRMADGFRDCVSLEGPVTVPLAVIQNNGYGRSFYGAES